MVEVKAQVDLSDKDRELLRAVLGCEDDALDERLGKVARAALQEHLDMFLGTGVFTRGSDFREHRLAMLALHAFDETVPSETRVSRMFQTTRTNSRSLLKAMLSKYQIRIEGALNASLSELLNRADADEQDQDRHILTSDSPALIDQLNQRLVGMAQAYIPISPLSDQAGRYAIDNATLVALKATV